MNEMENKIDKSINRFIEEIRQFSILNDNELRILLRRIAAEKPELFELLELESQRKTLKDIKRMIKEIKSRKVD